MRKLDEVEVGALAETLPAWRHDPLRGGSITREFVFDDFAQAFGFMTQVALAAEKHNHHPEWSNVYRRVVVTWTTHDVQGLSTSDVELARIADRIYVRWATGASPAGSTCSDS